ncbi:ribonuclease inhibitor [Rudanella paleaurantiibacter]|uniref:Ribonuclease inhibitor n=1 Tax=Rudanella paleaurantiibacter TaxID=2614655 RepID=A0A7J5TYY3_9BACT|nr:c-type cytochrome domain-containing protein [Rudanella paleaurantiibacter]KAB7729116.1 ribonuclease inhibitor [Rudanella paleaurantiibacter]
MILLQAPSDWALFFGHFHPLIVHLPIGFLFIAGLLEVGRRLGAVSLTDSVISLILFWSAVSATVACLFGYLLSLGGGYEAEILEEHQWQGIGVAVFAWVAWLVKSERFGDRIPFGSLLYVPALVVSIVLLMVAGHHGGALTHGSDYLTQYTPEPFRSLAGMPPRKESEVAIKPLADVNQALVYEQVVNPILQARCVQCHNAEKSKGDLRFDTAEMLRKGGEGGPVFVPGKGLDSELIKRCLLPLDDDEHMPPKGKTQLTDSQVAILSWWIDQGAPFDKKVADLTVTDAVKPALAQLGSGAPAGGSSAAPAAATGPAPEPEVLTMQVPAADAGALETVRKTGLLVMPLSKEQNQLEVSAVNARAFGDADAAALTALDEQLVWLKLSNTSVGDGALTQIAKLKNLHKLHLEQTKITDAGLKNLKGLPHLTYLNLYGTAISDAGLAELAGIKSLRTLYLWQTKVTPAGIAQLKKAAPQLEIIGGLNEQAIATFATSVTQPAIESPKATKQ